MCKSAVGFYHPEQKSTNTLPSCRPILSKSRQENQAYTYFREQFPCFPLAQVVAELRRFAHDCHFLERWLVFYLIYDDFLKFDRLMISICLYMVRVKYYIVKRLPLNEESKRIPSPLNGCQGSFPLFPEG